MTKIMLVRHGSTTLSEGVYSGSLDPDLSPVGRLQAEKLRDRLGSEIISRIYCSNKKRAIDTATIVAEPHVNNSKLAAPIALDCLREISHGRWEGKTRQDIAVNWPMEYREWQMDPFGFAPKNGETGLACMARLLPCMRKIVEDNEGLTALVVSHKAAIRLILCAALGVDARDYRDRFELYPASLTILEYDSPSYAKMILYNDTSHYK